MLVYLDWCPECDASLDPYQNAIMWDSVDAEAFDWECYRCGADFSLYWRPTEVCWYYFESDRNPVYIDDEDSDYLLDPESITEDLTLCCTSTTGDCTCPVGTWFPRNAMTSYMSTNHLEAYDLYDLGSDWQSFDCNSCAYYMTYKCIPLRRLLVRLKSTPKPEELHSKNNLIDICQHYEPDMQYIYNNDVWLPTDQDIVDKYPEEVAVRLTTKLDEHVRHSMPEEPLPNLQQPIVLSAIDEY